MEVPMSGPDITALEIEAVTKVLQTPHLSLGPYLRDFEQRFSKYTGVENAIAVSSGTAGLHLSVNAAHIEEGDLVITTPFSFIASANVILYERAIPVFVDVEEDTGNLDPRLIALAVEDLVHRKPSSFAWLPPDLRDSGVQPKAPKSILVVHVYGQPADMDPIVLAAQEYNVTVIEDACEAVGAMYKNRKVGSMGDASVFAFYPNKQMTTGEGGIILTKHDDWAMLCRSLRNQGRDATDSWLSHSRLGYNYRMDELSAALGLAQLSRIEELLTNRDRVAREYTDRLRSLEGIRTPYVAPSTSLMSWFVYVVRILPPFKRDEVAQRLAALGIPTRVYFPPIHLQPFYSRRFGYKRGDFPVAEALGDTCLALPFSGLMSKSQVAYVCERLEEALTLSIRS